MESKIDRNYLFEEYMFSIGINDKSIQERDMNNFQTIFYGMNEE